MKCPGGVADKKAFAAAGSASSLLAQLPSLAVGPCHQHGTSNSLGLRIRGSTTDIWGGSINGGTPSHHPFIDGFSLINHPAIGVPPFMETPILMFVY